MRAQGGRLSTGIAEMAGVVVIVGQAIMGMTLGTLGDYFALRGLAGYRPLRQVAPSITNLMANCATDVGKQPECRGSRAAHRPVSDAGKTGDDPESPHHRQYAAQPRSPFSGH